MPLLEVKDLAVRYDKAVILNGVSLAVDEGESYQVGTFEINGNRRYSTEELSASIQEINRQMSESATVTGEEREKPRAQDIVTSRAMGAGIA